MKLNEIKTAHPGEIVLLTKNQCAQCDHMKRRLNRMGEPYTEINLENDAELLADVKSQGAMSAPVMLTPRGNLITSNIVEMEKTLKQELAHPRYHYLYTPQEAQEKLWEYPEIDIPVLENQWDTTNGIGYTLGYVFTDEEIYAYSVEINEYGADISTDVYSNSPGKTQTETYPYVVAENNTLANQVNDKISSLVVKNIDNDAHDHLASMEVPVLETPRDISISNGTWTPTQPSPADELFYEHLSHATVYRWVDFQALSQDAACAEKLTELFNVNSTQAMSLLTELPHPKAVSDLAGAIKGVEVVKAQHPTTPDLTQPRVKSTAFTPPSTTPPVKAERRVL